MSSDRPRTMPGSSWLRSALNKAAEVGAKPFAPSLGRTVRSYAGSVYQSAAGGARLVQDRLAGKNNFKTAVKRLEHVSLEARGEERFKALEIWLTALKDIQAANAGEKHKEKGHEKKGKEKGGEGVDEDEYMKEDWEGEDISLVSSMKAQTVLFYDGDVSSEPLNFRDVFLRSRALENILTSLILEPPDEEEIDLVLQIFGLSLVGGEEVHKAIISGIQDLSAAASNYSEEIKISKNELLQLAQDCLSGLKLHAEVERIDAEIARVEQLMEERVVALGGGRGTLAKIPQEIHVDGLYDSSALKERTSNAEELLHLAGSRQKLFERKASFLRNAETPEDHDIKIERMKTLSTLLNQAVQDMKKKTEENRIQKQDALSYRVSKAAEVMEAEKLLATEVVALDKRRQILEAELKEVKSAIAIATAKHIHMQEEKEQFDVASSNIVAHLATQEEELAHKIICHSAEETAVTTWKSFMHDTWVLQSGCMEDREQKMKTAAQKASTEFLHIAATHVKYRQEELTLLLKRLKFCSAELETMRVKTLHVEELGMDTVAADITNGKKKLEQKYLEAEIQVEKLLGIVDNVRKDCAAYEAVEDKDAKVAWKTLQDALAVIDKLQGQIRDIERPNIDTKRSEELSQKVQTHPVAGPSNGPGSGKAVSSDEGAVLPQRAARLLTGVLGSRTGSSSRSRLDRRIDLAAAGDTIHEHEPLPAPHSESSRESLQGQSGVADAVADSDEEEFKELEGDAINEDSDDDGADADGANKAASVPEKELKEGGEVGGWEFDELAQELNVTNASRKNKDVSRRWMGGGDGEGTHVGREDEQR